MIDTATKETLNYDSDDDLDVERDRKGMIQIGTELIVSFTCYPYLYWIFPEHSVSTELNLVGLQVWRGAFLLADYILSHPDLFKDQTILELGSGVGLTSIVASYLAKEVICTGNTYTNVSFESFNLICLKIPDINAGDILNLIERNFLRNHPYVRSGYHIEEVNFLNLRWSKKLEEKLQSANIILAADGKFNNFCILQ